MLPPNSNLFAGLLVLVLVVGQTSTAALQGIDCREMTDLEILCEHKSQCEAVLPDLGELCRSFKRERYGMDEFVRVIDDHQSARYTITELREASYADASPPVIIQGPRNITVSPGSTYQFECKAEGAPTPELTITRREEASLERPRLKDEDDPKISVSSAHVIRTNDRVQHADEGWYRCVAANTRGVAYEDAYLRVYDLCQDVTCGKDKVCVPDHHEGTAQCVCPECVGGEYEPLCGTDCITYYNPCRLDYDNCRRGTDYTIFLNEFCPQRFTPPEFTELPPKHVEAVEGKSFTLTCRASPAGDVPGPPPIISWYRALQSDGPTDIPTTETPSFGDDPLDLPSGIPDWNGKLGDGNTIRLRLTDDRVTGVVCVAHQCKNGATIPIDIVSHEIKITTSPPEFNSWPGPSCQVFGDPTIITFDNYAYDFYGHCDYVLGADCKDKSWYVYGKFEPCSSHGKGSCLTAVTFYLNTDILIEMQRGRVLNMDGVRTEYRRDGIKEKFVGRKGSEVWVRLHEGWIEVSWKDRMNHINAVRFDGLMSTQLLIDKPTFNGKTCGLCGNMNGDPTDDWSARKTHLQMDNALEFGDTWEVDRYGKCDETKFWDWEREFGNKRPDAEQFCDDMFSTEQLATCAEDWKTYETSINPAPYRAACVADYMRSDYFEGMGVSMSTACTAAMNYAERCGNRGNLVHLWAEQTGCGTEDDMIEYQRFIEILGECLK